MTPTIIVQKPDETNKRSNPSSDASSSTLRNESFFSEDSLKYKENQPSKINSKHLSRHSISEQTKANQVLNSAQFLENSLVEYFQMATLNNTFDLYKIVEATIGPAIFAAVIAFTPLDMKSFAVDGFE